MSLPTSGLNDERWLTPVQYLRKVVKKRIKSYKTLMQFVGKCRELTQAHQIEPGVYSKGDASWATFPEALIEQVWKSASWE